MSMATLVFETGAGSDIGKVRKANEDRFLARAGLGLWAVSDGMGGHHAGQVASSVVVEELEALGEERDAPSLLAACEQRLAGANARLRQLAVEMGFDLIGATVVALLAHGGSFACLWSGDSRLYRLRGGEIRQLTRDHSEAEELLARGVLSPQEARDWPRRNVITRAIGVTDAVELEMVDGRIEAGDVFVLCSDGLTNHVADVEIATVAGSLAAQEGCDQLISLALDRGGRDNVTVIVVKARPREPTMLDLPALMRGTGGLPEWEGAA